MHEYSLTRRIIELAAGKAAERGASRVAAINLVVGDQAGVMFESVAMYFDIIAAGTPCEGAVLCCTPVPSKLKCLSCGTLFVRKPFDFTCPLCGGQGGPTEIGREFYIDTVELEGDIKDESE